MEMNNYAVCKDVLGIQTNSKYIGWSFGQIVQPVDPSQLDKCRVGCFGGCQCRGDKRCTG